MAICKLTMTHCHKATIIGSEFQNIIAETYGKEFKNILLHERRSTTCDSVHSGASFFRAPFAVCEI
jgi:hypothetical protein